jgi:hypothetical protein
LVEEMAEDTIYSIRASHWPKTLLSCQRTLSLSNVSLRREISCGCEEFLPLKAVFILFMPDA